MNVLGIDTSCDDTSVGLVEDYRVISNVISSQDAVHAEYGGVVPMLAKRAHEENFPQVLRLALQRAHVTPQEIEVIAVTRGPGLAPALEVGVTQAQRLAQAWQKPLLAVNHVEGHLLSALAQSKNGRNGWQPQASDFPLFGLIVSGKHTEIVLIHDWHSYEILGETVDDAIGEAYDKVARLLGLGYPGGTLLARFAQEGNPRSYPLPTAMRQSGDLNVSYSGLKTASLRLVRELTRDHTELLTKQQILDIAASFEAAAHETLLYKLQKAWEQHPEIRHLLLGGGVAANTALRQKLRQMARRFNAQVHVPYTKKLCRDNGAMIALAGYLRYQHGWTPGGAIDRKPQWSLAEAE